MRLQCYGTVEGTVEVLLGRGRTHIIVYPGIWASFMHNFLHTLKLNETGYFYEEMNFEKFFKILYKLFVKMFVSGIKSCHGQCIMSFSCS